MSRRTVLRPVTLAAAAVTLFTVSPPAHGGTVPINAFGRPGDLHVDFPSYAARQHPDSGGHNDNPPQALMRPVGDVNGDGRADIAMAISSADPSWTTTTWVTFSPVLLPSTLHAGDATWPGLKIIGAGPIIGGIAGLGDVNGDGVGDVAIAASGGNAWVVFGGPAPGTVDLGNLGDRGFSITGLSSCFAGGGGNGWTGIFSRNSSVQPVGDQNRDGRPDLAVCDSAGVRVVYTPADPAGAVVNAAELGPGGATLTAPSDAQSNVVIDAFDDVDGDGRTDIAVGWTQADGPHVAAMPLPAPGTSMALGEQASSASAWSVRGSDGYVERFGVVGDENADGRRDVVIAVVNQSGRRQMVLYGRPPGTHDTFWPLAASTGREIESFYSGVTDVGDQDGDSRADLAYDGAVLLSTTGEYVSIDQRLPECVTLKSLGPHSSLVLCSLEYKIAGALPDSNGDGKPELIAIHADPLPVEDGVTRATWRLDVFPSAPRPQPLELEQPALAPAGGVAFAGHFLTAPSGASRSLAARAAVTVADSTGQLKTVAGDLVDAGASASTRAVVASDAVRLGLSPGETYTYWMSLENGRGLTGVSARRTFTYPRRSVVSGPILTRLKLSPARFRLARGARVSYRLSQAATTTFRVARCVKRAGRRRCSRFLTGRVIRTDEAGANGFRLKAKVGTSRLKPGSYRLDATPKNAAGLAGRTVSVRFRVVR